MYSHFDDECEVTCKYCGQLITDCNKLSRRFEDCCKDCEDDLDVCELCRCVITPNDNAYTDEDDGTTVCEECFEKAYKNCEICGTPHHIDLLTETHDGKYVCESCRDEHYFLCEDCQEWYNNRDMVTDGNITICKECYDEYYFRCEHCNDLEHNDNSHYVENYGNICDHCYEWSDDFRHCEDCGDLYYISDLYWNDDDDCYYCDSCRDYHMSSINPYEYKPNPIFAFAKDQAENRKENLQIGFELEVDSDYGDDREDVAEEVISMLDDRVYCKRDGSLEEGFEIVSHPATYEWYNERRDKLADTFRYILSKGYTSHNHGTCGLHFHCDREFIEDENYPNTLAKLAVFYYGFYDKVYNISRRENKQWIYNYDRAKYAIDNIALSNIEKLQSLDNVMKNYPTSHSTVMNTSNRPTVEIRLFRGSLNIDTFMLSMQFVKEVCYIAKYEIFGEDCFVWDNWYNKFSPEVRAFIDANGKATRMIKE